MVFLKLFHFASLSEFLSLCNFKGFVLFHDRLACLYTSQCGGIEVVLMVCHTTSITSITKPFFEAFDSHTFHFYHFHVHKLSLAFVASLCSRYSTSAYKFSIRVLKFFLEY